MGLCDWADIVNDIPQGFILSLLLSNIFMNHFFFFSAKFEICCFACGKSLYSCGMNLDNIFTNLIQDTWNVYEWFAYNLIKGHAKNFQFIILGNTSLQTLHSDDITTETLSSVTLLGITIDSKFNLKEDINNIIKKIYYKLYTLRRLLKFQTF